MSDPDQSNGQKLSVAERRAANGGRPYLLKHKQVAIAWATEALVVSGSLLGNWLIVSQAGQDMRTTIAMMVAPSVFAVTEFARVPLALSARTQPSRVVRMAALAGVVFLAGVTTKTISQLAEMTFSPRLLAASHAHAALVDAQNELTRFDGQLAKARDEAGQAQSLLTSASDNVKSANTALGNVHPECFPVSSRKGKHVQTGVRCAPDHTSKPLAASLRDAELKAADATRTWETAQAKVTALDGTRLKAAVAIADHAYREAVQGSQLHRFTAMVNGKDAVDVTDAEVNSFLRLFVFLPSVMASLASSLLALTAVVVDRRPPSPPPPVEVPDDALLHIIASLRDEVVKSAAKDMEWDFRRKASAKAGSTKPSFGGLGTPPEMEPA